MLIVEPSWFRTPFNAPGVLGFPEASDTYADVLAAVRADMAAADGMQQGDPARAGHVLVGLVHGSDLPLRLALGCEAVARISASYRRGLDELERWRQAAVGADFADAVPSVRPI